MAAFERDERYKVVALTVGICMVAAIVLVGMLVFTQAHELSRQDVTGSLTIVLGRLELMHITKSPLQEGGSLMTLEARDGLFYYASAWLVLAVLVAFVRLKLTGPQIWVNKN